PERLLKGQDRDRISRAECDGHVRQEIGVDAIDPAEHLELEQCRRIVAALYDLQPTWLEAGEPRRVGQLVTQEVGPQLAQARVGGTHARTLAPPLASVHRAASMNGPRGAP